MSDFGTLPTSSSTIGGNNIPVSNAFVPGTAGGNMTTVEGLAINIDGNGYKSTGLRTGAKDGDIVTIGAKADSAATDNTSSWSIVSVLKGLWGFLSTLASTVSGGRIQVSGTFYQATQPVSGTLAVSSLPTLPSGTNVIGHVIVDSAGSVTISTLPSLPAGTNVIGHVIVDSASSVVVTALPALPTGTNSIGQVTANAGTNLNTSALAVESGGNLAALNSRQISTTGTPTSVTGNASAVALLASNASRKAAYIYNDSSATLYVGLFAHGSLTTSLYTTQVPPGNLFELPVTPVYTGEISGMWSSAAGAARITEMS